MTRIALGLAVAALAATGALAEDLIDATDPNRIVELAKGFGSANLETDTDGSPMITGRMDGTRYVVYFYGCDDGKECDDIQFAASWSDAKVDPKDINAWNMNKRFAKAYLDDQGDPVIDLSVNIDYGVTVRNLEDTFDWWSIAMREFKSQVLKM